MRLVEGDVEFSTPLKMTPDESRGLFFL
jgi:hypothetical protein